MAVAVVAVVIVVILALLLGGFLPGLGSSGGGATPSYHVTFSESGLPSGVGWTVQLGSTSHTSAASSIVFSEGDGTYSFSVNASGYAASPATGSITVSGADTARTITFAPPPPGTYSVTFSESGLSSGTPWSVTFNGTTRSSSTGSIAFVSTNGSWPFTVGAVAGYAATPPSGSVTVAGSNVAQPIAFRSTAPPQYVVTFAESGLPPGANWTVTFNGTASTSPTSTLTFPAVNGTYNYSVANVTGYSASPQTGQVTVSGANASVSVSFTASSTGGTDRVTFAQTGLPSNASWEIDSATAAGEFFAVASAGPSIEFTVPNGAYPWFATSLLNGYAAVPSFGNLSLTGAPVTVSIAFEPTYYANFTESGLASGVDFLVTLDGSTSSAHVPGSPSTLSFSMPNGSYAFTAEAFGYTASPASGTVVIAGASIDKAIGFAALPTYTVSFTETGLPAGTYWWAGLNGSQVDGFAPAALNFSMPNGTYAYTVTSGPVPGYAASEPTGNITVAGASVTKLISYTALTLYNVTFTETGLAAGTYWEVDFPALYGYNYAPNPVVLRALSGVTAYSVYVSGYLAQPGSGNVTVGTSPVTVAVSFTAIPGYNITFVETGLPSPAAWNVGVVEDGNFLTACYNDTAGGTSLTCMVPSGNYTWFTSTPQENYTGDPAAGWVSVSHQNVTVDVVFANASGQCLVEFVDFFYVISGEGGLPNGSSWSVTVGGVTQTSEGMAIFTLIPDGVPTAYTIASPAGYVAIPSSGNLTCYGGPYQGAADAILTGYVFPLFVATSGTPATPALTFGAHYAPGGMRLATARPGTGR